MKHCIIKYAALLFVVIIACAGCKNKNISLNTKDDITKSNINKTDATKTDTNKTDTNKTDSTKTDTTNTDTTKIDSTKYVTFEALVVAKDESILSVIYLDKDNAIGRFNPVTVKTNTNGLDLSMGDIIKVYYNGNIDESYPCQIGADKVEIIEKVNDNWPATKSIPAKYTISEAASDHCFVTLYNKVKSKEFLQRFIDNSKTGIISFLRNVSYTVEGDPIIADIIYDGDKYYVFEDDTRDNFAGSGAKIYKNQYRYLNTIKIKKKQFIYLADRNNITVKEYEKSLKSNDSKDQIKKHQLYIENIE